MSDSTSNVPAAGGSGGDKPKYNDKSNEKSNDKSKEDYRKKIKCRHGKLCSADPCPYLHSSTHVPHVPVAGETREGGTKTCQYDTSCHNKNCKFKHSDGYVPHPTARCRMGDACDFNDDDTASNEKCHFSHPDDEWWNDLPVVAKPTFNSSSRGRGGFRGGFRGAPRGGGVARAPTTD